MRLHGHPQSLSQLRVQPAHHPCRLRPFGVRITALRRKPWASHTEQAEQQNGGQQPCWPSPGCQQQSELEAAADAALADRGCWGPDTARLAAEADIVAGEHNWASQGPLPAWLAPRTKDLAALQPSALLALSELFSAARQHTCRAGCSSLAGEQTLASPAVREPLHPGAEARTRAV